MRKCLAWSGGAVFVASLVLCTWSYLFWLGRDLPLVGWRPVAYDAGLISIFAGHHSVFPSVPGMRPPDARCGKAIVAVPGMTF